jgi:hypothetical protein
MTNTQLQTLLTETLRNFELSDAYGHRAVGDKIEDDCSQIVSEYCKDYYIKPRSKKSIEDFTIKVGNQTNWVDVKTHYIQNVKGFSMPNLISIDKLRKSLMNPNENISYVFVSYKRENGLVLINKVLVKYIWELDWDILGIGSLGKGQLQIKDANKTLKFTTIGREEWAKNLKVKVKEYHQKRLKSIQKEIDLWQ